MPLLTRENWKNNHYKIEKVDLTEWSEVNPETGEHEPFWIYVREVSAAERDQLEDRMVAGKGKKQRVTLQNLRAKIVALSCCDEHGHSIYRPEDETWLGEKPVAMIDRIVAVFKQLNDFTDEDEEELVKN
jgi:hypothetical protein